MSWFNPAWPYRQAFTIDNSDVPEDLTDFPVTINLLAASGHLFHWDLIGAPSGIDIRFADEQGNECNFDMEKCDLTSHILIAHVKMPVVSGGTTDQKLYMYYGNPDATAVTDAFKRATWNSGYALVCHMTEKNGNTTDATTNAATASETTLDHIEDTFINNNYKWTTFSHRIDFTDDTPIRDLATMTFEVMAHIDVVSDSKAFFEKGNFYFETVASDRKLQFTSDWSTTDGKWKTDDVIWTGANEQHNIGLTYDRGLTTNDPIFYVDGIEKDNTEQTTPNGTIVSESGQNLVFGNRASEFFEWRGEMDEIRVSNVLRSSGWIRATSRTLQGMMMSLPGALEYATVSGVEVSGWWNSSWDYRKKLDSLTGFAPASTYASGQHYLRIPIDVEGLAGAGKLQATYDDLRVTRQNVSGQVELPRYIASGVNPAWVYFPCEANIPSGLELGSIPTLQYYVYYGNSSAALYNQTWPNWNCPQAPFNPILETNKTPSGYYDKFFLRCNDESGPFLYDSSEHFVGNNRPSGQGNVAYDQPGRLDKSIYIPGSGAVEGFRIPGSHVLNPSGYWFFDCWIRPADINKVTNYFVERVEDLGAPYEQWATIYYGAGSAGSIRSVERTSVVDVTDSRIAGSGDWVYYRTMWHDSPDSRQSWLGASGIPIKAAKVDTALTPSVTNDANPLWIGPYVNSNEVIISDQGFHGWLEQIRFGVWQGELAPGGISTVWTEPYWVENEQFATAGLEEEGPSPPAPPSYTDRSAILGGYVSGIGITTNSATVGGYASGNPIPVPPAYFGGYALAAGQDDFNRVGLLGGYVKGQDPTSRSAVFGGYTDALPLVDVPIAIIGGKGSGLYQQSGLVGGFTLGEPNSSGFAEARSRTLVKAVSDQTPGQTLGIDAQIIFKGFTQADFNAQIAMANTDYAAFMGRVNVQKYKTPPTVVITSVTPTSGGLINGARQVSVTASGNLGDGSKWQHAYIDFGEPFSSASPLIFNEGASISGFTTDPVWTTTHDYQGSGIYAIVARGVDDLGMVGTDIYMLNLASGLVAGTDYPLIQITATPRSGWVPDSVQVTFTTAISGVGSIGIPADQNILWNFGNRETSQLKNPITHYHSPGLYAPTLRWRYTDANQRYIWVADSLLIGYNR